MNVKLALNIEITTSCKLLEGEDSQLESVRQKMTTHLQLWEVSSSFSQVSSSKTMVVKLVCKSSDVRSNKPQTRTGENNEPTAGRAKA
ncbi:hypothetical protein GH733_019264 [Mirounga leonina]|nr:hypothetical protein GH733_019264 [Mirounga leonina]